MDREKAEKTFESTWEEFRDLLAKKAFSYDQTDKALESVFLKQFDQLFQMCGKDTLSISLKEIFDNYTTGRGTILNATELTPYSRFLPIAIFIDKDNRFSPPGVESRKSIFKKSGFKSYIYISNCTNYWTEYLKNDII